jgi:hypothetical protein
MLARDLRIELSQSQVWNLLPSHLAHPVEWQAIPFPSLPFDGRWITSCSLLGTNREGVSRCVTRKSVLPSSLTRVTYPQIWDGSVGQALPHYLNRIYTFT